MFNKVTVLIVVFLLSAVPAFSAGSPGDTDGGNEGKVSKYEKGHKLVLSGKHLEKKSK